MSQNIKPTFIFIATLGILSMLPPLGVDMYIPSFLNIAEDLNINSEQVQYITAHADILRLRYGGRAIVLGPFGISFGRKPIILLGVIIGAITSIILTGIHSIGSFTALRFIQGFFWCCTCCTFRLYYEIYLAKINLESCHHHACLYD